MDFRLSEEQEMIRKMARDFADNEVLPYCQQWDEEHIFPWDTVKKLHELGLMTCGVPAEYGGPGIDHLGQCIISEEISRGDATGNYYGSQHPAGTGSGIYCRYPRTKEVVVRADDGRCHNRFCLTEPGVGSDAAGLSTRCKGRG